MDTRERLKSRAIAARYFAPNATRRRNVESAMNGRLGETLHRLGLVVSPSHVTELQKMLLEAFKMGFEAGLRNQIKTGRG